MDSTWIKRRLIWNLVFWDGAKDVGFSDHLISDFPEIQTLGDPAHVISTPSAVN
jgi:hypothetical protein